MSVYHKKSNLISYLSTSIKEHKTIGLVPTMGALHQGHLSLLEQSLKENDVTVISIFVNPTQFNNADDLAKYPRTLERDVKKIAELDPNIIVFAPTADEVYGNNVTAENYSFNGLENQMEGAARPGHFDGVGTIITKLFDIVKPTKAYFGEKDFQQLLIIKALVKNYHLPTEIIGCPIYRESDGLAMSSRNERLSAQAKTKSTFLFQTLTEAQNLFKTATIAEVKAFVENKFKNNADFELEYFEIADQETLITAQTKEANKKYRGFLVAYIEGVRLIDNILLN
ncbi:pantoate--beta-alanine ligase [Flavobacterium agricola]|uniref:Pantothenate synthetase n=1 Tax=Flavobacterium agricola TaxID=2870839 RepID=A0ABY6M2M4_9FLAO|nr:pantoate--beta-alanine ligase [Flavobacterium agricola]UYW01163.1 pantoate--beta-alanine ligase [Flavobacterium agricola]